MATPAEDRRMRIALATLGTWGDVQPFVHLAGALRAAGHDVVFLTQPEHRTQVMDECGARVVPICRPFDSDRVARLHRRVIEDRNPVGQVVTIVKYLMARDARMQLRTSRDALADRDLLVAHGTAVLSQEAALLRAIPCLGVVLAPAILPSPEQPAIGLPDLGRGGNRLLWRLGGAVGDQVVGTRMRRIVRHAGGLRRDLRLHQTFGPDGILVAASPALSPRLRRRDVAWTGPWHRPPTADVGLPAYLERFLAEGDPPLFVGFGSMEPGGGRALGAIAAAAARGVGRRLILQRGWAGLEAEGPDICVVDHLSHDRLLPRVAAIAHHCGAGTTHAAARSGRPSVPVPFLADQPWWAGRLQALGAATPAIPRHRLSSERLQAAFGRVLADPALQARARRLAEAMQGEDGCARAVRLIEVLGARNGRPASDRGRRPDPSHGVF
jgi:sterol 3beta-glucosyltransferase